MADYNRLATLVGTHQELALFRNFKALNVKNLLYMQAELVHLQSELETIELDNKQSGDEERSTYLTSLFDLKFSEGSSRDLQWRKILEIREKLKCYSTLNTRKFDDEKISMNYLDEALLQIRETQRLHRPGKRDVQLLQEWLERPEGGDFFLRGREAEMWDEDGDLVTLSDGSADKDSLTKLITDKIIPWYHTRWGHRVKVGFVRHAWYDLLTNIFGTETLIVRRLGWSLAL